MGKPTVFDPYERAMWHLEALIRIPSASGHENKLADYCFSVLEKTDFIQQKIHTEDGRYTVYAEMKGSGGGKTLMLAGHIDTVPVVDGWETDPFEPVLKTVKTESSETEERLYALGANDMKPGIALMLTIAEHLAGRANDFSGVISMAFLPDEEAYSAGARALIKSGVKAGFCLMPEPSYKKIYIGAPGKLLFQARSHGKAAHGARPREGVNAVAEMGKFLAFLERIPLYDDGEMGAQPYVPFTIKGGPDHYSLSIPEECGCAVSKQLVPGEDKERVFRDLEEYVKTLELRGSMTFRLEPPYYLPYRVDETAEEFKLFENICIKRLGKIPPYKIGSSVSDANCLAAEAGIPVLTFGCDGFGSHQKNEYLKTESLAYVFDIYRAFIFSYLKRSGA